MLGMHGLMADVLLGHISKLDVLLLCSDLKHIALRPRLLVSYTASRGMELADDYRPWPQFKDAIGEKRDALMKVRQRMSTEPAVMPTSAAQ